MIGSARGDREMSIVFDTTKFKIREYLDEICKYAGLSVEWTDEMWLELISDEELYNEFIYYLENHTFLDKMKVAGYGLSDIYVWQMDKYNLIREIGKNPTGCNKETMVMNAFKVMPMMKREPEKYVKLIESGRGNDMF